MGRRSATTPSWTEDALDVRELALQRPVLRLEELVGHPGGLEHREAVGGAAVGECDGAGGKDGHRVLRGAGEHVDDAAGPVGLDAEVELSEAVDDLDVVALLPQLARELRRPLGEMVDVRHVVEDALGRRVQHRGDRPAVHRSITPLSARTSASRSCLPKARTSSSSSSPSTCSATARNARPRAVRRTLNARPSTRSRSRSTSAALSQRATRPVMACLERRAAAASSPSRAPSRSKSGTSTEPYDARTSPKPAAATRSPNSSLKRCWAFASRNPTFSVVARAAVLVRVTY